MVEVILDESKDQELECNYKGYGKSHFALKLAKHLKDLRENNNISIGFDQIKDMKIKDIIKLKEDKVRLEKENTYLKAKYPMARVELEKDDFDMDKFLEELN